MRLRFAWAVIVAGLPSKGRLAVLLLLHRNHFSTGFGRERYASLEPANYLVAERMAWLVMLKECMAWIGQL